MCCGCRKDGAVGAERDELPLQRRVLVEDAELRAGPGRGHLVELGDRGRGQGGVVPLPWVARRVPCRRLVVPIQAATKSPARATCREQY